MKVLNQTSLSQLSFPRFSSWEHIIILYLFSFVVKTQHEWLSCLYRQRSNCSLFSRHEAQMTWVITTYANVPRWFQRSLASEIGMQSSAQLARLHCKVDYSPGKARHRSERQTGWSGPISFTTTVSWSLTWPLLFSFGNNLHIHQVVVCEQWTKRYVSTCMNGPCGITLLLWVLLV